MAKSLSVTWGAQRPAERGPIVLESEARFPEEATAFGLHGDLYGFHRGMAKVLEMIPGTHAPDLSHTRPPFQVPVQPEWGTDHIATMDPWGHCVATHFADLRQEGVNISPSVAVNTSYYRMPEIAEGVSSGRLKPDCRGLLDQFGHPQHNVKKGAVLDKDGVMRVTEITGEQVWHLPTVAAQLGFTEEQLREMIYKHSGRMFPQLIEPESQRLKVMLPPLGGFTIWVFGNIGRLAHPNDCKGPVVLRPHDSCDDGDVGACRCTCRDFMMYAIEEAIQAAQQQGIGVLIRYVSQGRGFGSVPKHLVYAKRDWQPGGDTSARYFDCTNEIMGGKDGRLDFTKVGPILWTLGTRFKITKLLSQSPHKLRALTDAGIQIEQCHRLPLNRITSKMALREIEAKTGDGYLSEMSASPAQILGESAGEK